MSLKSGDFFLKGTNKQFEFVLEKYQEALRAKAESKKSKPETILKLDKWFHNDLPKKIKSRGKDAYLTHEEIVQCMKWKLHHGVFRAKLKDLIQMNTPRVVMDLTRKAFRAISKRDDLESAVNALSNLKGVGPAFASAVLAAFAPDRVPYMSDEVLLSMPDVEEVDFTMKEYNKMVDEIGKCISRLNSQGGNWTPHKVDMAVFSYYILREHKPQLLKDLPEDQGPGGRARPSDSAEEKENQKNGENVLDGAMENGKDDTEGSENGKDDTEGSENGKDDTEGSENGNDDSEGPENGKGDTEDLENGKVDTHTEGSKPGEESDPSEDERETPDKTDTEKSLDKIEPEKEKSPSAKRPLECEGESEEADCKRAREERDGESEEPSSPHKTTNHVLLAC